MGNPDAADSRAARTNKADWRWNHQWVFWKSFRLSTEAPERSIGRTREEKSEEEEATTTTTQATPDFPQPATGTAPLAPFPYPLASAVNIGGVPPASKSGEKSEEEEEKAAEKPEEAAADIEVVLLNTGRAVEVTPLFPPPLGQVVTVRMAAGESGSVGVGDDGVPHQGRPQPHPRRHRTPLRHQRHPPRYARPPSVIHRHKDSSTHIRTSSCCLLLTSMLSRRKLALVQIDCEFVCLGVREMHAGHNRSVAPSLWRPGARYARGCDRGVGGHPRLARVAQLVSSGLRKQRRPVHRQLLWERRREGRGALGSWRARMQPPQIRAAPPGLIASPDAPSPPPSRPR